MSDDPCRAAAEEWVKSTVEDPKHVLQREVDALAALIHRHLAEALEASELLNWLSFWWGREPYTSRYIINFGHYSDKNITLREGVRAAIDKAREAGRQDVE